LAFAADVDDTAAKGNANTQTHEQQRGGFGQGLCNAADAAQRALHHCAVSLQR
jgi:hypothetical protein